MIRETRRIGQQQKLILGRRGLTLTPAETTGMIHFLRGNDLDEDIWK